MHRGWLKDWMQLNFVMRDYSAGLVHDGVVSCRGQTIVCNAIVSDYIVSLSMVYDRYIYRSVRLYHIE